MDCATRSWFDRLTMSATLDASDEIVRPATRYNPDAASSARAREVLRSTIGFG